jgi:uncharacterized protein (DUF885 family)
MTNSLQLPGDWLHDMFPARHSNIQGSIVKQLCTLLTLLLSSTTLLAGANDDFEQLAQQYVSELPALSPVNATAIGDHSADDELDDVSANARARLVARYRDFLAALDAIDRDSLSRANQVDAEILRNELRSGIWSVETLQEWAWNPLYYVNLSGNAIYSLMARDFAGIEQRLNAAAARLEQMPRFLQQTRNAIDPQRVPKIHAETAIQQNPGLNSIVENMIVPEMDALSSEDRQRLHASIETAKDAIATHQSWLEEELLPRAAGDFRVGAELFDQKLSFAFNSPLGRREISASAEAEYEAIRNQMYEISKTVYKDLHPYTAFPDAPDETYKQAIIRAALEQAYQQLPPRDAIIEVAEAQLKQATEFVIEKNIVTMPDDPVDIIVMPEFQRGVAVAYLDPPGALDQGQKAFYAIAPLPEDWTDAQVRSFLREYNLYSMQDVTIHEGVPGHYLQVSLSKRYPSALRSVLRSGTMVEGWAVYAEQMMIDEGYQDGDPLQRLIALKWYLRVITNAIIDSAIHVDGMTRDQAMKLMIEGGFQEEREAAGKWVRAQVSSTQLSTYFVGYQEWAELRADVEAAWGWVAAREVRSCVDLRSGNTALMRHFLL